MRCIQNDSDMRNIINNCLYINTLLQHIHTHTHTQQRAISSANSFQNVFFFFKNLIENDEKQNLISDGLFNKLLDGWFLNLLAKGELSCFVFFFQYFKWITITTSLHNYRSREEYMIGISNDILRRYDVCRVYMISAATEV